MGRVYALDADESKGEIRAGYADSRVRVYLLFGDWQPFRGAYRVEFDEDTDCGDATVYARFFVNGVPMRDPDDESQVASVRFRAYAKLEKVEEVIHGRQAKAG